MIVGLAMLCGALTSAAWVARKPFCYAFMVVSAILFIAIKEMQQ